MVWHLWVTIGRMKGKTSFFESIRPMLETKFRRLRWDAFDVVSLEKTA